MLRQQMDGHARSGRKIGAEFENPLDDVLMRVCEAMEPGLHALGVTPNMITGASVVFGAAAAWALWEGHVLGFAALYSISYFLDVLDGDYARRYDMVTEFGDMFDHINDAGRSVAMVAVLLARYRLPVWAWGAQAVALVLMGCQLGCQQLMFQKVRPPGHPPESLDMYTCMCPFNDGQRGARLTRWVGVGTAQALFVLLVCCFAARNTFG